MQRETRLFCVLVGLIVLNSIIFRGPRPVDTSKPPVPSPRHIFVISDEELQGRGADWRKETLREAIRLYYPGWAGYSQQRRIGKMVVTYDLAKTVHEAGGAHPESPHITVSPWVILTVLIMQYGESPPPGFDAWETANRIFADIDRLFQDSRSQPEMWQGRFANTASYMMYRLFSANENRIGQWLALYHRLVTASRLLQPGRLTVTPTVVIPLPFLERPFVTPTSEPPSFYRVNSFLDHRYPLYRLEPISDQENFLRFDGQDFTSPIPVDARNCHTGQSCYTGHDGLDYSIPEGVAVRSVAAGTVVYRYDNCGFLIVEHEQNGGRIYTEYMHMSEIFRNEGNEVSAGEILGSVGDVDDFEDENGDGKDDDGIHRCWSGGSHLHFAVRFYFNPLDPWGDTHFTKTDPFGWWGGGADPWEEGVEVNGQRYGGYTSRWLWWGDEAGDGYYTVDDTESQAQLFYYINWWHDPNGYNNGAWWTYEVESEEESTNWAIWGTYIETPGTYVVQVHWPQSGEAEATTRARYRIYSAQNGLIDEVWVDQEAGGGEWYTLGVYDLPEGPTVVILTDWGWGAPSAAGGRMEQETEPPRVYFDAVRWATSTPQATPTPTPTFTPTPTPTPTRTPTPTPQPTPTPPWGWWMAAEAAALQERSPQEREAFSCLLSQVRDEVMAPDPKGEAYIRLTYRYAPEVTALWLEDEPLRREVATLMDEVRPLLEGMVNRRGEGRLRLSRGWVERAQGVLRRMEAKASPELAREIRWWQDWLPRFAGKTGWEIWQMLPVRVVPGAWGKESPEEAILRGIGAAEARAYGALLSRVRDEVLLREGGEAYVARVYRDVPEVVGILLGEEGLRREAEALLVEARPGLEALLAGGEWRFSRRWVERTEAWLREIEKRGSPALQAEAQWWLERVRGWVGKTPREVWNGLLQEERQRER